MKLVWFRPKIWALDQIDELSAFGIVLRPARRSCTYQRDPESSLILKEIGDIRLNASTGEIRAIPREDATERDVGTLLGAAVDAFRNKPTRVDGWLLRRVQGQSIWWTSVVTSADNDDSVVLAMRSALHIVDAERQQARGLTDFSRARQTAR